MTSYAKLMGVVLVTFLLLSGSGGLLPAYLPSEARGTGASQPDELEPESIFTGILPSGTELATPENPSGAAVVSKGDIDGDGADEMIAGYRGASTGIMVLREKDGKWTKAWDQAGEGHALDLLRLMDVDRDGLPEIVAGWAIGASAGNALSIYKWLGDSLMEIGNDGYHRIEIEDMPGEYRTDGIPEFALWQKDTGDAFGVEVVRYNVGGISMLVDAEDVYPYYYKKVAEYYEPRVRDNPAIYSYRYYYADALGKAGMGSEALKAVEECMPLAQDESQVFQVMMVKARALASISRYDDALALLEELAGGKYASQPFVQKNLPEICKELGRCYRAMKDYKKSGEAIQKAMDIIKGAGGEDATGHFKQLFPYLRERQSLNAAMGADKLQNYLFSLVRSDFEGNIAEKLELWAEQNEINVRCLKAEEQDGSDLDTVLLDYCSNPHESAGFDGHAVCWWSGGRLGFQYWDCSEMELHGFDFNHAVLGARVSSGADGIYEMGIVYDSAYLGSGSEVPIFKLLRLEEGMWQVVWSSPRPSSENGWHNSHGKVTFTGNGLSEFVLEGDSWNFQDDRLDLFHESNPGPHRYFREKWIRTGDRYILEDAEALPSAYNTLVDFVYYLSRGMKGEAEKLATGSAPVEKAIELGMVQQPVGQRWLIEFNSAGTEQDGPITLASGPAAGARVDFTCMDGHYLISGISRDE